MFYPHNHHCSSVRVQLFLVGGLIHKYECDNSTHHFHDLSAPLREQLQTLQSQIKQLPVFRVRLLGLLTPWAGNYLQKWENKAMREQVNKISITSNTTTIIREKMSKLMNHWNLFTQANDKTPGSLLHLQKQRLHLKWTNTGGNAKTLYLCTCFSSPGQHKTQALHVKTPDIWQPALWNEKLIPPRFYLSPGCCHW